MKKRGLASPDDADALALTFAENVLPSRMRDARLVAGLWRGRRSTPWRFRANVDRR
jgi:hypothetical protein